MRKKPQKPKKTSKELQFMGKYIKDKRKSCGLTQGELAEQTSRGLRHLQSIEAGRINPSYEVLAGIAQRLAMSVDCIIFPDLPEVEKDTKQLICKFAACTEKERQFLLDTMDFMKQRFPSRCSAESDSEKME